MTTISERRAGNDRREADGQIKIAWPIVVQVVTWIVAALLTYGAITARIAVVESKQNDNDRRQDRIELKIDRLEGKVDRVLERVK